MIKINKNAPTTREVSMAKKVAKKFAGNMTKAVREIEKIKKGLSDYPRVVDLLKQFNEEADMYYHEEYGFGEILESTEEKVVVLFPHGVEEISEKSSCGSKKEDNTNDTSDDGEGLDKVQPKALKKKFKDRKDKDIDNDGDEDESDEYLHNRRKTISKKIDEKEDCPKCDSKGCGHCDNKGYHESLEENRDVAKLLQAVGSWSRNTANKNKKEADAANADFWVYLQKTNPKVAAKYKEKDLSKLSWTKTNSINKMTKNIEKFLKESLEEKEEEISELKKSTYARYLAKAAKSARARTTLAKDSETDMYSAMRTANKHAKNIIGDIPQHKKDPEEYKRATKRMKMHKKSMDDWKKGADNRVKGIARAGRLLAKEETQVEEETQVNENFTKQDIETVDTNVNNTMTRAQAFLTRMWENSAAGANAKRTANAVEAEPQLTVHDKDSVTGKTKKYHDDNTVDRKDDEEQSHDDAVKASKAVKSQAPKRGSENR